MGDADATALTRADRSCRDGDEWSVHHGSPMQMYTVIFERDGEALASFHTHAVTAAAAHARALAFFREHPEHDPFAGNHDGIIVRVEKASCQTL
jgi:hypothetical protein